ncbi:hypothetical protein Tco_0960272 [Tanacetum coccineum]
MGMGMGTGMGMRLRNVDGDARGDGIATLLTPSKSQGDAFRIFSDSIAVADLEEAHGRFGGLTPSQLTSDVVKAHYEEALRKNDQMHQTFEMISLAMTCKLDDMMELPESQSNKIYKENLECEMFMVKIPRCLSWLGSTDGYDEPICSLEVEETLGTLMEDERLDQMKLEDVGLTNYNISLSSREVPSFDELESQPQPLPSYLSLDEGLGEERGPDPPTKPHSPDSHRMVVDHLTIYTPPSSHAASFYPKDVYCYYHPCIDNPKKHYGFKPGLQGSKVIEDDFLGE